MDDRHPGEAATDAVALLRAAGLNPADESLRVSTGWLDLQVNGFAGFDVNAADARPEATLGMLRRLWQEGVARCCPTVVTQSAGHMARCVRAIADACAQDADARASVLGIHLEGPYISPLDGARGAHPREHVRPPDWDEFARWQEAAGGLIRIVTLAPEAPGAIPFIARLAQSGVVVGLGHTLASADDIRAAADAGATLSTHLGNGSPATLPRHPNMVWEQLAEDRLMASAIFDGHHLPASVMKVIVRAKGVERAILVSDAVALARMPPGVYDGGIGGQVELRADGRLSVLGTPYLAGSASSLKDCLENAVRLAGCRLDDALRMASANPAALLQAAGAAPQPDARTVFRWDAARARAEIAAVLIDGRVLHAAR